ncbi:MAG: hypothetical protein IJY42_05270 [Clostridia bacterium]|nr:hypothetical protein [Clostridia bacterium]
MKHLEQWIWLPESEYPNEQTTVYSGFFKANVNNYTVAEFVKTQSFSQKIIRADLRFSGDSVFQLFCNGRPVATGPACVGGDFIENETVREPFYAFEESVELHSSELNFFVRVQMMPYHICEYSKGHGGFMLSAVLHFEDGTQQSLCTDESWLVRRNGAYHAPKAFDGRISPDGWIPAERTENIWHTVTAPIPVRQEEELRMEDGPIVLAPDEEKTLVWELDQIWGGFVQVKAEAEGEVSVLLNCRELMEKPSAEQLLLVGNQTYRGFCLHSVGNMEIIAKNRSSQKAELTVSFLKTHYPIAEEATTVTDDSDLNQVLQTCKHTLQICRQTHHLDSTRHCEPMACTGDYYIESLMTPFSFGDMRLAQFDLLRTAQMLERENGRMFHTTYSLIWVKMLYDVYMLTANRDLLNRCERALSLLLARFETYLGDNGLIESAPDYMFIDWIYIDGLSLHHPPKALGQSCLNLFYFGALDHAAKLYDALGEERTAELCRRKREALRCAINELLFDAERGCYFEGLNTPTEEHLLGRWMPQNVETRYYRKHSNILAAYFGVCDDDTGRDLIGRIMSDEIEGDCQPYFLHYLLEAVYRLGLRERYTLTICNRWKEAVRDCPKGLVEGFVAPEPTYRFDHSHAWGGTPLYSLPKALLGLEITKPGMKELSLSPSLLGLTCATVELLTPYGKVTCKMREGEAHQITHPKEVRLVS